MTRASFIPRSTLLTLAVALVAVAALFAGGAPAEAQSPATVTRTDIVGKTIEVRAGKYYTIGLVSDDRERLTAERGWIGEGNLGEFAVAVGEVPPAGGLTFACSTVADSAGEADYVGGIFPVNESNDQSGNQVPADRVHPDTNPDGISAWSVNSDGVGGVITLPIVTKSDYELEGDEYFWIECLPSLGSQKDEWQAWPSPRIRVRIVDATTAVRFVQPAYTFTEGATGTLQAIANSDYETAGGAFERAWDVTANVINRDGSARITEEYTYTPASIAFEKSTEPQDISVTLEDNDICEAPKTFTVRLAEPSDYRTDWGPDTGRSGDDSVEAALGRPATARVTIIDDGDKLDAPQALRAELDGSTLKVSEWRRPPGCLANGVEMEYKLSSASSWTAGYKGGITWDYDGDGDPTNNNGLGRDVSVELSSAPAADAVFDVRVRLHNNATGGGKWAEANTINETAEFTGLTVTSPDGSVTYELGNAQESGFESGATAPYVVHVPPGLREVQVTVDWTATPETGTSVGASAKSYAFTGAPPKSASARLTSSAGVTLIKNTAATVPLAATGGTDIYLGMTATFTGSVIVTDEVRLVVLRNNAWESANDYLKGLTMSSGGSQPAYWPWPSWVNPQYTVENVVWAGPASPAGGRLSQWSAWPTPWAGTPAGLPQASGETLALTPAFDDEVYEYTARVPHNVALVTLHPITDDPEASVTVNGKSPSTPVSLSVGENVITVVVTAENGYQRTYTVTVTREFPNRPPAVVSAIADATIINESGTRQFSLSGVFSDPDDDDLTITANSSDDGLATVSVSADYSTLTVTARGRGTAVIGVNANDGEGGEIWDLFFVKVKAAPVVAQPLGDVSELEVDATHEVSLSSVFSDPDGDRVTVTEASSSDTSIAAVSAAIDGSTSAITAITVTGVSEGTATITVTARDADGNTVQDAFDVTVNAPAALQQVNNAPTVSAAIADTTIVNETGTHRVALSGVFSDADGDALTVTASSSAESVASVAVSADYSTLTVSAKSRGTATVTVTAADGYGGSVADSFTVRVKAAPVVASAISDVSGLEAGDSRTVSLSGVFSDGDGDSLTVTASSSDNATATVSVSADRSTLTVSGVSEGTATITVTAQDTDGNTVSDAFDVTVVKAPEPEPEPVELPGPVLGLELTATHDSVSVSWSAPESGDAPDGYIVNIKRQGGGDGETRRPGAGKTALTFRDLNSGSTYEVWVRAENEAGKGERVRAGVTLPSVLPGPVTGLEVAATEDGVTVSWSAPETGGAPDGYIVHIRPEGGAEGSGRTKTPKAKKTKVTFENLEAGRTYNVWVRAENEAGKGERVRAGITIPAAQ